MNNHKKVHVVLKDGHAIAAFRNEDDAREFTKVIAGGSVIDVPILSFESATSLRSSMPNSITVPDLGSRSDVILCGETASL